MSLDFRILGPIEVCDTAGKVVLGGPQQRRTLAILLSSGGAVVPVERLGEAIWDDEPPEGARRTVMTYVSRLRLALGDGYVVTQDPGYRLVVDEGDLDAARFERLAHQAQRAPPTQAVALVDRALALWRGPAYGEFAAEWWAVPHASRLEELRLVALETRIDALLEVGAHDTATADLERLVAEHPLRQRFVAQLMRSLDASGRRPEALRVFAKHREVLVEETGLEPSEELRALERSILDDSPRATAAPGRAARGYVLHEVLGEGSFGTVHRASQPSVGRDVAVKVVRADLADDPEFVRRFEAEAQLVAHLEHPHIVPLYDFWREPGGAYLVFRLLRGGTAHDLVRREGPIALDRVDRVVTEVGGALAAAHAAGVVHRDVKPANVLFDDVGHAYLADFGIATSAEHDEDSTPVAASPRYSPPEQFAGERPSPRGDQYSFGAVIWELLAGAPPVEGSVPRLRERRRDLHGAVDDVLARATAADPAARFDDIDALLEQWHRATAPSLELVSHRRVPGHAADVVNPYLGLRAFGPADARHYRGRDALVERVAREVRARRLTAIVGASGSGKTSLLHAGVVPKLRAGGLRVVTCLPGEDPVGQLRNALLAASTRDVDAAGRSVAQMVSAVAGQSSAELVVVVDQLEELWTLPAPVDRDAFLAGLVDLAGSGTSKRVRVVVAVRADFFERGLQHPALGPLLARPLAVTPMTAAELHEAIVGPAAAVEVVFEPGLEGALVAEVASQPASLPMLQFTLHALFVRRDGHVIPQAGYDALGGIAGAISGRAEALYGGLDDDARAAVRRLLLRLVVVGDGPDATRRRVRRRELPAGTEAVALELEAARLLVADRDPVTREPTVELAHEALLRSWPRAAAWIEDDRDRLRRVEQLEDAAAAWDADGRPESELYRGARLDGAEALIDDDEGGRLGPVERDFVVASRAATDAAEERERRTRRRLRRGLAVTAVALVASLVAGAIALEQRRDADEAAAAADVARLVSLSESLDGTNRDVALLVAVEASRRDRSPATTGALLSALYGDLRFAGFLRSGTTTAADVTFSPDGRVLYVNGQTVGELPTRIDRSTGERVDVPVASVDDHSFIRRFLPLADGTALVERVDAQSGQDLDLERVSLDDGRVLATSALADELAGFAVSPDGDRVAVSTIGHLDAPGRVLVLDTRRLREVASFEHPGPPLVDADLGAWYGQPAWTPAGEVVTGSPSGRVAIWDPGQGEIVQRLNDPPDPALLDSSVVAVTPDGETVLVSSHASTANPLMAYDLATGAPRWPRPQTIGSTMAVDPVGGVVWAGEDGFASSRLIGVDVADGTRTGDVLEGQHGAVCTAAVSPDGATLVGSSCNEGIVTSWALDGRTLGQPVLLPPGWATSEDMWSADGSYVAGFRIDADDQVAVVDVTDGSREPAPGLQASSSNSPSFERSDGRLQAVVGDDHRVVLFDPSTRRLTDTSVALDAGVIANVVVLPGGSRTAYGLENGTVEIVDTDRGEVVRRVDSGQAVVLGLAASADGQRLFVAGQDERLDVYDTDTGDRVATLDAPAATIERSDDGRLLAVGAFDGTLRLFEADTLAPVGDPIVGGLAMAAQLEFTPDGQTLVAGGLDQTLRLFDVTTGIQLGPTFSTAAWGAAVRPDSTELAITTSSGVQRVALDPAVLRDAACIAAGRNLTATEWRQYLGGRPRTTCPQWSPPS